MGDNVNGDGSFIYTPAPNFHGIDTFTYHASDGVHSDMATVSIAVETAYDDPEVDAGPDLPLVGEPSIGEGDAVSFEGSFVDPQPQSLLAGESIHWDFGDGNTATGTLTPIHTYLDNDVYTVTLTDAATGLSAPAVLAQAPMTLKMQGAWPASNLFSDWARQYVERVNAMSGGRIKVEYLPSGATRWVSDDDSSVSEAFRVPGNPVTILVVGGVEMFRDLSQVKELRKRLMAAVAVPEAPGQGEAHGRSCQTGRPG